MWKKKIGFTNDKNDMMIFENLQALVAYINEMIVRRTDLSTSHSATKENYPLINMNMGPKMHLTSI